VSFQTGVLNFALFTKLPLPPSPHTSLSVLAVTTAFASAAGHAPRPSPLRASGVSLKLRDIATRRHPVRARRGPPSKRHGDAVSLRPTALALSLAQDRLEHSTSSHTSLSFSPPCSECQTELPMTSRAVAGRH